MKALAGYVWRGNVRELENIVERALALCSNNKIAVQDLQLSPGGSSQAELAVPSDKYPLPDYLDDIEKKALLEALQQTSFNRTAAAKLLGLSFRTMRYRMERLGIKPKISRRLPIEHSSTTCDSTLTTVT